MKVKWPQRSSLVSFAIGLSLGVGVVMYILAPSRSRTELAPQGNELTIDDLDLVSRESSFLEWIDNDLMSRRMSCDPKLVEDILALYRSKSPLLRASAATSLSQFCRKYSSQIIVPTQELAKRAEKPVELRNIMFSLGRFGLEHQRPVNEYYLSLRESDPSRFALFTAARQSYEDLRRQVVESGNKAIAEGKLTLPPGQKPGDNLAKWEVEP